MDNLFSIFDPASWASLPLNWSAVFLTLTLFPAQFWLSPSQSILFSKLALSGLLTELKAVLGENATPGIAWVMSSMLAFLAINNSMGLFPYVFTPSSHLIFTLPLSLILWGGFFLLSSAKRPLSLLSHLVPLGTPYPLMPFMVLIESVSNLIRPLTLAVRLAANMVAGHLLLTLMSSLMPLASWGIYSSVTLGLLCLLILETAVALIQAYVFTILSSLYIEEVESFSLNLSKFSTLSSL